MKTKMATGGNGGKTEISTRSEDVQMRKYAFYITLELLVIL